VEKLERAGSDEEKAEKKSRRQLCLNCASGATGKLSGKQAKEGEGQGPAHRLAPRLPKRTIVRPGKVRLSEVGDSRELRSKKGGV